MGIIQITIKKGFLMRRIIRMIFIFFILTTSFGFSELSLEKAMHYDANKINQYILYLEDTYESLDVVEIGRSELNYPIYALRISKQIKKKDLSIRYSGTKNYLVISGVHAREVINPIALLSIVEGYLRSSQKMDRLNSAVIHIIPLVNPDGFNLAKYGKEHQIFGKNFNRQLKSNNAGIDLNRNFPDAFYDSTQSRWVEGASYYAYYSNAVKLEPSVAFYHGKELAPETRSVIDYMEKYYFELFIDMHSKGQFIFWKQEHLSDAYNENNKKMANFLSDISTSQQHPEPYIIEQDGYNYVYESYGYSTHYFANTYGKPAVTLETTAAQNLPYVSLAIYRQVINRWKDLFEQLVEHWKEPASPHRVYHNNIFYSAYPSKAYAQAVADKLQGEYIYESGSIRAFQREVLTPELLSEFMSYFEYKPTNKLITDKNYVVYDDLRTIGLKISKNEKGPVLYYDFVRLYIAQMIQ